jgi:ubiquinone/menaquinone biosynthesis C-methylase UbiE
MVRGHAEALPFADTVFDMIFCECVLSVTADPGRVLREFARTLAPGGFLALSDLTAPAATGCLAPAATGSCAHGALPLDRLTELVVDSGFETVLVEDHTGLLNHLAARLILAGEPCACTGAGYCLLMARTRRHHHA